MSKKQILGLWIIALALAGGVYLMQTKRGESYASPTKLHRGDALLTGFQPEKVGAITIKQGDKTLSLKETDGVWTVAERAGYPAMTRKVNELLRTLAEVKITQGIEAGSSLGARFGMDADAAEAADRGTEVTLSDKSGAPITSLTFGKNLESNTPSANPFGFGAGASGRFVRNHAEENAIYVTSELFSSLDTTPSSWLDDTFLKMSNVISVAVSEPGKADDIAWSVSRKDAQSEFQLDHAKEGEKLNQDVMAPLKNLFSYARFDDVLPGEDAQWVEGEQRTALITTADKFSYRVTFGPMKKKEGGTEEEDNVPGVDPYLMTVTVAGEIPSEREKAEEESEEDAKAKDEAFETEKKALTEQLENTHKLEGHTYKISKYTVDALIKTRDEIVTKEDKSDTPQPGIQVVPPGEGSQASTDSPPRDRVQAVTPPIAIPPLSDEEQTTPEQPAEPAQEQSAEPAQEQPAEPAQEQPAEPAQEQPAEPAQEQPAEPAQEQPAEPAKEQPAEPAQEQPAEPAQEQPAGE